MKNFINIFVLVLGLCFGARFAIAQIPIQNSDADILSVVAVIDQNEIQMAHMVEQKNVNRHILDYAKMLDRDHNKNLDQDQQLSQELGLTLGENSGTAGQLQSDGNKGMAALSSLDQVSFSREFISDMIKGHTDVLNWIDNQQAQNERVKRFLNETRKYISKHLKKAQYIQVHVL